MGSCENKASSLLLWRTGNFEKPTYITNVKPWSSVSLYVRLFFSFSLSNVELWQQTNNNNKKRLFFKLKGNLAMVSVISYFLTCAFFHHHTKSKGNKIQSCFIRWTQGRRGWELSAHSKHMPWLWRSSWLLPENKNLFGTQKHRHLPGSHFWK